MTDHADELAEVRRAAAELIPELSRRLARHGLGELEVRSGRLRVRVAGPPPAEAAASTAALPVAAPIEAIQSIADDGPRRTETAGVTSPAVGFFVYGDGLGPGLEVDKGDGLGWVEMLGVRHDVRAPRGGTVRNLVAESGEAVEYGQVVLELAPAEAIE